MMRDFSSRHASSVPSAFFNHHKEETNQPQGLKAKAKNVIRGFNKLRRDRITVVIILAAFNIGLFLRVSGYWGRPPAKATSGQVSADVLEQMKEIKDSIEAAGAPANGEQLLSTPTPDMLLPNVLIIGAAYCGTNPLSAFLSLHPNIAVTQGQLRFFTDNYEKGLEWYSSQIRIPNKNQYALIERSPNYLYSIQAPKRVKAVNASMKIIAIFRNPTKRLISDYTTAVLAKMTAEEAKKRTFEKMVIDPISNLVNADNQGVTNSIYYSYVKRWLDNFPKEQFHAVDGESFIKNPLQELKSVETFLGVPHVIKDENLYFNSTSGYFCPKIRGEPHCYGHTEGWRHLHQADFSVLEKLKNFFRHHNENFYDLMEKRFEWS